MIKTKRRGLKAGLALTVVLMLMFSLMPGGAMPANRAEAYGENEDDTLFYAETWLYDYKYDREVQSDFAYNNDNQIAYKLNGGDHHVMSQEDCHNMNNGDRWMTGLQVPYEMLNRRISSYYSNLNGSTPALYFGNFLGTATNLDDSRGNNEGQTPWQYTYIPGQDGNKTYVDAYSHYWQSANNAPKNNNGNVAVQGLIDRTLKDGKLTQNNGTIELPQFSDSFISANSDLIKKYSTGEGFPFNIIHNADGTKTYEFDSAYDAPRYYQNGEIKIGTINNNGVANWRSDGNSVTAGGYGFFPFNTSSIKNTEVGRYNVNYGFGMRVDIPFNLNENGTILDKDGHEVDVHFNFSGDDDVWVFIDDVMLLDIGGDHAKVSGNINFKKDNQQVYVSQAASFSSSLDRYKKIERSNTGGSQTSTIKNMFQAAGVAFNESDFYNPRTVHTLTVFYMERGMFESNLSISFNFAPVKISNPHKLTVKEQTVFDNVNAGLIKQTVAVADKDIFNYSIENKGTAQDDVTEQDLSVPTYDYIDRNNTEEGNTALRNRLSGQPEEYTTKTSRSFDSDHIYIIPNSEWTSDGKQIAAWVWKTTVGGSHYVNFTYDSATGYYKANRDGCDKMKLVSYSSGQAPAEGATAWKGSGKVKEWGHDIEIPSNKNLFQLSTDSWSDTKVETTISKQVLKQEVHPFAPAGTGYSQVAGVTYQLTDPFGVDTNSGAAKTTLNRDTTSDGHFGLMYGEEAYFPYQFAADSTMRVKQENSLLRPMNDRATTMGSQTGSRTVSDYYDTTVEVVDIDQKQILYRDINAFNDYNNANGTYTFANAPETDNETIHLTETYINTIKVGAIKISKLLENSESGAPAFTFKVTLTKLFGDTTADGSVTDYSGVDILIAGSRSKLKADGTFSLAAGQTASISGIPVGTAYHVAEVLGNDSDYEIAADSDDRSVLDGVIAASDADNTNAVITEVNRRKTGSLKIIKTITGDGADKSKKFSVTVSFTAPSGVDLGSYINRNTVVFGSTATTGTSLDVTFEVTDGTVVTFTQIPYGTTYVVNEDAGDYQSVISYGDQNKKIDSSGDTDTVSITNTKTLPDVAAIVIKKIDNYNNAVTGAEFRLYQTQADANTAFNTVKNHGSVSNGTAPSKNTNGDVFTFENLTPNTTYYIVETVVPEGYQGMTRYLTVTTGAKQTTVTKTAENPKIEIVMPETGGTPFLIDFSMIGVFAVGLAAAALIIYKRKLQSEAVYTDEKGRYKS